MSIMEVTKINESFCEYVLQAHQKYKNIRVIEVKKKLATTKGENYLSEVYRIFARYEKCENEGTMNIDEICLIIKINSLNLGIGTQAVNDAFRIESHIFRLVLPKIEKNVGCSVAPFFFHSDENSNYIAMEDLKSKGYVIVDVRKGLSFDHCLRAIEKMAKFHAGSVAIAEREHDLLKPFFGINALTKFPDNYYKALAMCLTKLSKGITETWNENEYLKIADKINKLSRDLKIRISSVFKYDPDEFCVLNHGDFWISNVMFKHDQEGKPLDALMIDFQMVSYTSPAIDLQQFLAMCPELELKGDKDDYFIKFYLLILENTMKELGCKTKPPTMDQLIKAMLKRGIYSVLTGLIYFPRIYAERTDVESFNEFLESGDTNIDYFKYPLSVKTIRKFAKIINDNGYLD